MSRTLGGEDFLETIALWIEKIEKARKIPMKQ